MMGPIGIKAHFWKWRCFVLLSLAEQGDSTLSVGETIDLSRQFLFRTVKDSYSPHVALVPAQQPLLLEVRGWLRLTHVVYRGLN